MRGLGENAKPVPGLAPGGMPKGRRAKDEAVRPLGFALHVARGLGRGDRLIVADDERRAEEVARALRTLAPGHDVLLFQPWDCFPYDRVSPSREVMGTRVAVLHTLAARGERPRLVVTCPEALAQKVAPPRTSFTLAKGVRLDVAALAEFAARTGYLAEHRVDDAGEIAIAGHAVDLFPAGAERPIRLMLDAGGTVETIRLFDPTTQRTEGETGDVTLLPASEVVLPRGDAREGGIEHRLPAFRSDLVALTALMPGAAIVYEGGAGEACLRFRDRVDEAYDARCAMSDGDEHRPTPPDHLYLTARDLKALKGTTVGARHLKRFGPVPDFSSDAEPERRLRNFLTRCAKKGFRTVLAGLPHEREALARAAGIEEPVLLEALDGSAGDVVVATCGGDFDGGIVDRRAKLVVIAAADVFGARLAQSDALRTLPGMRSIPKPGDVVVHEDHGVAILRGLKAVEVEGSRRDMLELAYHGGDTLMAPVEEFDRLWRYGSEADSVALDRLRTDGWNKRRVKVSAYVEDAAARLVALAAERARAKTPPIKPGRAAMARFAAGFAYPETTDQRAAIADVGRDLASGRPMDRLICGDVGFGKTEVALRAAAAVALSGRQVAVIAPTTVLARQHAECFSRRFADSGVGVVHLSRFASAADVKDAKARLASGEAAIVVGTQTVASDVRFADLALVIVDEEHRLGTRMKDTLRAMAPHHLALSATPIPRTLQGALVGVQDVSLLTAPPARRRAVRTMLGPFDAAVMQTALLKEKRRDGQSFVVVPRIDDVEPVLALLAEHTPDVSVAVAHGELAPEAIEDTMVRFAAGAIDVLVATSLIESGLDVPRANTMLIWGADKFGLAQLHQLRGRVGRGRTQGIVYLFAPDDAALARTTADRLAALVAADRLGAGFTLSARDLDLRGGGDLVGDEQAGHIRLIGASLYQHLLEGAVRAARGETREARRPPEMRLSGAATIPADYVPDEIVRIELYARFAALGSDEAADALRDELRDRFGDLPEETVRLLSARRLAILAERAGVTEVAVGPKATALSFCARAIARARSRAARIGTRWKERRLILDAGGEGSGDALRDVLEDLAEGTRGVEERENA